MYNVYSVEKIILYGQNSWFTCFCSFSFVFSLQLLIIRIKHNINDLSSFQESNCESAGIPIENRIYIRGEFRPSLGMIFFSLKGSSKCTNHVNVHKLYAVEYINTVCSLDYPFHFQIF